jgi:hypothetical protein
MFPFEPERFTLPESERESHDPANAVAPFADDLQ